MFSPRFIIFSTYLEGLHMFFSTLAHRSHHFAAKSGSTSESARQRCISFTSPDRCPQNRSASEVLILLLICWFGRLKGWILYSNNGTHTHTLDKNGSLYDPVGTESWNMQIKYETLKLTMHPTNNRSTSEWSSGSESTSKRMNKQAIIPSAMSRRRLANK